MEDEAHSYISAARTLVVVVVVVVVALLAVATSGGSIAFATVRLYVLQRPLPAKHRSCHHQHFSRKLRSLGWHYPLHHHQLRRHHYQQLYQQHQQQHHQQQLQQLLRLPCPSPLALGSHQSQQLRRADWCW
jgi:hypothetical protein